MLDRVYVGLIFLKVSRELSCKVILRSWWKILGLRKLRIVCLENASNIFEYNPAVLEQISVSLNLGLLV